MKVKILFIATVILVLTTLASAQNSAKTFRGFLDGKRIQMNLTRDGGKISGTYLYAKYGTNIRLAGTIDQRGKFVIYEYDAKNVKTGEFDGTWNAGEDRGAVTLEGEWKKPNAKTTLYFSASEQMVNFTNGAKLNTKYIEEKSKPKRFDMSGEYPELIGVDPSVAEKFNQLVKTRVMKSLAEFKKGMTAQTAEDLKYLPSGANNYIEISYNVVAANDDYIGLSFGDAEFTGGAHPNYASFTINYDLNNNRELALSDLFKPNSNYLKIISDYAVADLKKQLTEMSDDEWIKTGAGAETKNFASWNLTNKGLLINFDPYQVAAYAAGPQEVLIPYGKLKNILKADGVAANL